MPNDKLQQLTDRLYEEGLSKGRQEAEKMLSEASAKAAKTIEDAKRQAEEIIEEAQKKADDILSKAASDVKTASRDALAATKQDIQNAVLAEIADAPAAKALKDEKFVADLIAKVAGGFSEASADDALVAAVSPAMQEKVEEYVKGAVQASLKAGIKVQPSKKIRAGFTIGPSKGGWFVDFTDEAFNELIREYMRPATKKILFGEGK